MRKFSYNLTGGILTGTGTAKQYRDFLEMLNAFNNAPQF